MKNVFLLWLFSLSFFKMSAQIVGCTDGSANNFNVSATMNDGSCTYSVTSYSPSLKTNLNATLIENSALILVDDSLWTLNDSENKNALYKINPSTGEVLRTVIIRNALNIDWESMAQSSTHIFIGDFGNNDGTRQNLRVLKIKKEDLSSKDSVTAEFIAFHYSDQTTYNSTPNFTNFDGEALIYAQDSLHIFSKNWANLKTKHYRLTANADTTEAVLQEEFDVKGLITDASYSSETGNIVLLGYKNSGTGVYNCFSWLLFDYSNSNFFSGNKRLIELGSGIVLGQTEGVVIKDDNTGFISSEKVPNPYYSIPPKLHSFNFSSYFKPLSVGQQNDIRPNVESTRIVQSAKSNIMSIITDASFKNFALRNLFGQVVLFGELSSGKSDVNISSFVSGVYFLTIEGDNKSSLKLFKK